MICRGIAWILVRKGNSESSIDAFSFRFKMHLTKIKRSQSLESDLSRERHEWIHGMMNEHGDVEMYMEMTRKINQIDTQIERLKQSQNKGNGKGFKCKECGDIISTKCKLKRHVYMHTNKWPFKCDECGQGCRDKYMLTRHNRTHTGALPFACAFCGLKFSQKSNCTRHEKKTFYLI